MTTIVIDLARILAPGRELDWLLSYEVEAVWRRSALALPRVPAVPGELVAVLVGGAEPVSVSIGHDLPFTLRSRERRCIAVTAGQRIDVLPANVVRLERQDRPFTGSPVARPARWRRGPERRRVPPP